MNDDNNGDNNSIRPELRLKHYRVVERIKT